MICVDVGSGYNPKPGYMTCDNNYGCDFYNIDEIPDNYVDQFHLRNVIHHIENLHIFAKKLYDKQRWGGGLQIIDCIEGQYHINYLWDLIWYRYVNFRNDIFISNCYRDFESVFLNVGYFMVDRNVDGEKLILTLKK